MSDTERLEAAEVARRALNLLDLVLGKFYQRGHPGKPCVRSDWVAEDVLGVWRDVSADLRASLPALAVADAVLGVPASPKEQT